MTLKIILALALAAAFAVSPAAAFAHEGHDHVKKAKKLKKSKAEAGGDRIRRPAPGGLIRPLQLRVLPALGEKDAIASAGLTTC